MTAAALTHACRDASLEVESLAGERVGLILGCGLAGQLGMIGFANEVRQQSPRFVSPIHFPQTVGNYIAGALARGFHIRGPNMTVASGPASGLDAIVEGCDHVLNGRADVVFAGGTEQLSQTLAEGLAEAGVFLSEGACLFVLEASDAATARGAEALATVVRWGHMDEWAAEFHPPEHTESATARAARFLSVAGCRHPGAIFIEDWIGRCPGALGGAAVAAAIGAAGGISVPLLDDSDQHSVSVRRVALDGLRGPDGAIPALIIADADGAHQTTLEMAI
jgi:3-oxoacyl-(acyl-carrier-protein) synthase